MKRNLIDVNNYLIDKFTSNSHIIVQLMVLIINWISRYDSTVEGIILFVLDFVRVQSETLSGFYDV